MATARFQLFTDVGGGVSWRFVASNNRDLARSSNAYGDEQAARDALVALRAGIAAARVSAYVDPGGRWRWDLNLDGPPVAQSSRGYQRRIECDASLAQFRSAVSTAELLGSVAAFRTAARPRLTTIPVQGGTRAANGRVTGSLHRADMRRSPSRSLVAD